MGQPVSCNGKTHHEVFAANSGEPAGARELLTLFRLVAGEHVVGVAWAEPTLARAGLCEAFSLFEREIRDVGRILIHPPWAAWAWLCDPSELVVGGHCLNPLMAWSGAEGRPLLRVDRHRCVRPNCTPLGAYKQPSLHAQVDFTVNPKRQKPQLSKPGLKDRAASVADGRVPGRLEHALADSGHHECSWFFPFEVATATSF